MYIKPFYVTGFINCTEFAFIMFFSPVKSKAKSRIPVVSYFQKAVHCMSVTSLTEE